MHSSRLHRRAFLSSALLLSSSQFLTRARAEKKIHWKTAIGLNGFQSGAHKYKKNYPIWEVAHFASRNGFNGVELVSDWPMGPYPLPSETGRIAALRKFWNGFDLQIFSIQFPFAGSFDPDPRKRDEWFQQFSAKAMLARQLGCECIGLWPVGQLGNQSHQQALENLALSFRKAAEFAQSQHLVAAFELEPPFVFHTESDMKNILSSANHPNLKVIYDPSHFDLMNGSTGRPHEMLKRIGLNHLGYLQFADTDGTLRDGGTSKHLGAGDGHVDIKATFQTLIECQFDGWIMIDAWEVPDPYDAPLKGIKAIRENS